MGGPEGPWHHRVPVDGPGTYQVTVTLGGWQEPTMVTLFLGRRRCVLLNRSVVPMETVVVTRTECLGPIIPRGHETPFSIDGLDVTVIGGPWIRSVEVVPAPGAPVIHIAGDSTVTDQSANRPYDPGASYCGWGQMLPLFAHPAVAVCNHAHSGLTTESFRTGGHWALMEAALNPGDLALFQFGHNDQKLLHLDADGGYATNLHRYIEETQARGALPVLVSPVSRSLWNGPGGAFNDLLGPWARATERVARERGIPFVDLHRASVDQIVAWGREGAKPYFFPGDYTHHNDFGGWQMAALVHQGLRQAVTDRSDWWIEPAGRFAGPVAGAVPTPSQGTAALSPTSALDSEGPLSRAEALTVVMSAARILPCQVYNDAFTDVFGDEWYAGSVQAGADRDLVDPEWKATGRFEPDRLLTGSQWVELAVRAARAQGREGVEPKDFPAPASPSGPVSRQETREILEILGKPTDGRSRA